MMLLRKTNKQRTLDNGHETSLTRLNLNLISELEFAWEDEHFFLNTGTFFQNDKAVVDIEPAVPQNFGLDVWRRSYRSYQVHRHLVCNNFMSSRT
jgi:hypothetical protein